MKSKIKTKKPLTTHQQTNATTRAILDFLMDPRLRSFAWRQNTLPVPLPGGGFRSGSLAGVSDILGLVADSVFSKKREYGCGVFLAVEVKTGRDKLRPAQEVFLRQVASLGGITLVVKDYGDFLKQWESLCAR